LLKQSIDSLSLISTKINFVIVDEAHISIAESYKLVIDSISFNRKEAPALLGLTATPGRTWNDPEKDLELAKFFYRQQVTLSIPGFDNPVDYLVNEQYLAKVKYKQLYSDVAGLLTDKDLEKIEKSLDIPKHILEKLAANQLRNLKIIDELERLSRNHSRIMFFGASVEHSNLIASILKLRGHHANSVTSGTETSLRESIICDYKATTEDVRFICNFGVLTTGFDAPQTSAALIARPTQSLVLYSQMIGRAIRGKKAGGNIEAEIVTVIDSQLPGFDSVASAFTNWEDIWE
jgi:DNA repair protein RadD